MIDPSRFDKKLNELREIERRMVNYDHKTPITKVLSDQKMANNIYRQLSATIKEFKSILGD